MVALELLDGGQSLQLGGVEPDFVSELIVDPVGGFDQTSTEAPRRRRGRASCLLAPTCPRSPPGLPSRHQGLVEHRLQPGGREPPFGLDLLAGGTGSSVAFLLCLLERVLTAGEAAAGDDRGR